MKRAHRQSGYTLIELLMATVITGVVAMALGGTYLVGYRSISLEANEVSADQAVSSASLNLTRDLSSGTVSSALPLTLSPGSGSMVLSYGSPAVTVTYTINGGKTLLRAVSGGLTTVAGRGISQLTLSAGTPACYLSATILPSASGASAQTMNVGERTGGCF
jgi:prepilin-type N-terminal cleavage/methylation domain-containing protein